MGKKTYQKRKIPTASVDELSLTKNHKKKEIELQKINRILRVLSKSNQAIVRAKNELSYLKEVCKLIQIDCGHATVWIGYVQNDANKSVKPMTYSGFEKGYLETLHITWANTERGRGPTGIAIRTGKVSMCKNMLTDPTFEPWRKEALKRGYASSIVFPLLSQGKVFGVITIYSRQPDPFSDEEINFLTELANDVAYGIVTIRLRVAHSRAERELRQSQKRKDEFISIVSHELKTPLTSMKIYLQMAEKVLGKSKDKKPLYFLNKVSEQSDKILMIINDLFDTSKIEAGKLSLNKKSFYLDELVRKIVVDFQFTTETHRIIKTGEFEGEIIADEDRIGQVITNLLTNAIKYSPHGGDIIVNIWSDKKNVYVSVQDFGIGIAQSKQEKIFERFFRVSEDGGGGIGLGLYISSEIIKQHEGKIRVKSKKNKGSTFTFQIPLK
ncbi:MAG TPA: GAF domain-containing sensor histidine kinase [Patescibacteria group bacterium]|nr:GAF domain-containing sensor histidine kinase [Patescibacteria group bacterium]